MIATRCSSVDTLSGGGVQKGVVTEYYGPSGAGKTTLTMQLALSATKSIFVVMKPFAAVRLHEMASHMPGVTDLKEKLETVEIRDVYTPYELNDAVNDIDKYYRNTTNESNKPDLLVIDCIEHMFRGFFANFDLANFERANLLKAISYALQVIAQKYNVAVVVCNEIGFTSSSSASSFPPPKALGKPWMKHHRQTYYMSSQWVESYNMWVHTMHKIGRDGNIIGHCNFFINSAGVQTLQL